MLLEDLTRLVSKDSKLIPVSIMDVKMGLRSFRQVCFDLFCFEKKNFVNASDGVSPN